MQHSISFKISAGYALFGALWILLTDRIIVPIFENIALIGSVYIANTLIFICISTMLLYACFKRKEASWQKSDIRYQRLFESVNDAIFILKDSQVVECNQKAQDMFARSKNELIGHKPWEFSAAVQPDGSDSTQTADEKYSACVQGSAQHFEWEHLRPDNTLFYTEASLYAFEWDRETQVLAIIRDVTLQKHEKDELDIYKHIVSASIDSLALVGRDYRYKAVSRVYAKRRGKNPDEVCGHTVSEILGPEFFEQKIKPMAERCMDGKKVHFQNWATFPDGRRRFFDVLYYPHFEQTKKGEVTGYVVSGRDITEMHQMENKLRQAYKMEAIGTLAGGIAHDFNNILMVILWHAEDTLKQTKEGSELHTGLTTILEAASRAADLVKQILTFSRQSEQELYPVQIHLVIKEVAKFMRASLPATIEIQTKIESESLVLADPTQIHQVMMNLCTNAGHAMKEKGGILTITLNNVDLDDQFTQFYPGLKPGPYVKLSVSDTGSGIPPEIIDRIFDPFFTTKAKGEGTGMGLSVVHGIVESCGGSISVYSEPDGTIFHVYLPVMEIQTGQALDQPVPIPRGSETVLFVDDEIKLVKAGQRILEQLGYKVVISTSGQEAYEKFSHNPEQFDLVITDLTMPHMTGDELARKIRQLRPNVPILMITGLIPQTTTEALKLAQVDELIMKPLTTREIATAIRQVLNDKESETKG